MWSVGAGLAPLTGGHADTCPQRKVPMKDALTSGLTTVANFVPKLVVFLLILIIGILVAKAIGKALSALLTKVGFDRAVERGGVKKALDNSKLDASDLVGKLIYYTLLLFVLQLAFGVFGPNPISDLLTQVITFLPSLIVAIVIIVVASAIAAAVKLLIEGTLGGLSYGKVLANAASVFILFLGVVAALNQIGVATTVTTPILIMILATIGGVIVIGVGGGLIKPMQHRWEEYLTKAEAEAPRIREHAANAPSVRQQAEQRADQARAHADQDRSAGATSVDDRSFEARSFQDRGDGTFTRNDPQGY